MVRIGLDWIIGHVHDYAESLPPSALRLPPLRRLRHDIPTGPDAPTALRPIQHHETSNSMSLIDRSTSPPEESSRRLQSTSAPEPPPWRSASRWHVCSRWHRARR